MTPTTSGPGRPDPTTGTHDGRIVKPPLDPAPPQAAAMTEDDRARQLQQLYDQLAACRREREQAEHDAGAGVMLQRAIVAVRRDRDAGTSATLRRNRSVFERLLADIDDVVVLAARMSVRLGVYGLSVDNPHLHSGVAAGNAGLDAIAALAAALDQPTSTPTSSTPSASTAAVGTDDRTGARRPRGTTAGSAA